MASTAGAFVLTSDAPLLANAGPVSRERREAGVEGQIGQRTKIGKFHGALKQRDYKETYKPKDTKGGHQFRKDSTHHLTTTGCFKAFFPGAGQPNFEGIETEHPGPNYDGSLLNRIPPAPKTKPNDGPLVGCTSMYLQHRDNWPLFKSETVVRNNRMGLALWTGVKDTLGYNQSLMHLHIMYHLAFYERGEDGQWRAAGGLAWGSEDLHSREMAHKLSILFPDGRRHSLTRHTSTTFETDRIIGTVKHPKHKDQTLPVKATETLTEWAAYTGIWTEVKGSGHEPALRASPASNFLKSDEARSRAADVTNRGEFVFDPTEIKGYDREVDIFRYEADNGGSGWKWKRLVKSIGRSGASANAADPLIRRDEYPLAPVTQRELGEEPVRIKAKPIVDGWYRFLREFGHDSWSAPETNRRTIMGKWQSRLDYCRSGDIREKIAGICGRQTATKLEKRREAIIAAAKEKSAKYSQRKKVSPR